MLEVKDKFITSTIFGKNILTVFGTVKLSIDNIDQKIFSTLREDFPFIKSLVIPKQVHKTRIKVLKKVEFDKLNRYYGYDGLVTRLNNVALAVLTGDCLPVVYSDGDYIAISHQGWRGSLDNMAGSMVKVLIDLGVKLKNLKIAMGPSIGACCYSIDKNRADLFVKKYPNWQKEIILYSSGKIFLNLPRLNYLQLLEMGVSKENIDFFPFCTSCDHRFYSFRRDGKLNREMLNFVIKR